MSTNRIPVNSATSLSGALSKITSLFKEHKYLVLSVRTGRDRTLDQNSLWFALYKEIATRSNMGTADDVRKYCKLHFGVPILRRDCHEFRAGWDKSFIFLSYEEKLNMMGPNKLLGPEGMPVTRLFNRKQGIEYTNRIVEHFRDEGVYLDDLLNEEVAA